MGDMEFNGTPEEWDALVKKNKEQETLEEREPYWDLVDAKAEQNNTIDLDAYAKGVQDGAKWQQEKMYSEEEVRLAYQKGEEDSYLKGGQTKEMEDEFIQSLKHKLNKSE